MCVSILKEKKAIVALLVSALALHIATGSLNKVARMSAAALKSGSGASDGKR